MEIKILPKIQRDLWEKLAGVKELQTFYLAGGTAMALHLGHRESIDFDFFQPDLFKSEKIVQLLSNLGPLSIEDQSEGTLVGKLEEVKVSFFQYKYPLISPIHSCEGISVADLRDIAAMKIIAISQRGVKKDFIDLHALINAGWNLEAIFQCVEKKFTNLNYNKMHLLKSLTYFKDAEREPDPKMLKPVPWVNVKRGLQKVVKEFTLITKI